MVLDVPLTPWESKAKKSKVCVTGVTGYVAGPIVERLLAAGHTVHGTVRSVKAEELGKELLSLPGAKERLKLFEADLLKPGSFDEAMKGCTYVIHTAMPFLHTVAGGEGRAKLIDPALQGTRNVLESVNREPSVKRVVLTSSMAAVTSGPGQHPDRERHVFTEEDWSEINEHAMPYNYAKHHQEKLAWEMAGQQSRWMLVSINPGMVMGPSPTDRSDSTSIKLFSDMITGKLPLAPGVVFGWSDIRCVAAAHCIAAVNPACQGRYMTVASESYTFLDGARWIKAVLPDARVPMGKAPYWLIWLVGPMMGASRMFLRLSCYDKMLMDTGKMQRDMGSASWWIDPERSAKDFATWLVDTGKVPYKGRKAG